MPGSMQPKSVGVNEADVREIFTGIIKSTTDPAHCEERWAEIMKSSDQDLLGVLTRGWQACVSDKRSNCTNVGVVAALVLSFVSGMSLDLPEPVTADEGWDREAMYNIYSALLATSTALCLGCVLLSIIWVNHSTTYAISAEEYLALISRFPTVVIDVSLIVGVLCFAAAFLLGVVLVKDGATAYVSFFICLTIFFFLIIYYVFCLVSATGRMKRNCEMQMPILRELVPKIFKEHKEGKAFQDTAELFKKE